MTPIDAGPLVAILNPGDQHHAACTAVLPAMTLPFVTTLPALTEAMFFLGEVYGFHGQAFLWKMVIDGRLRVAAQQDADLLRMEELMRKYSDAPMDLADASLVALLESLQQDFMFTVDSHFRIYRLRDRRAIRVAP